MVNKSDVVFYIVESNSVGLGLDFEFFHVPEFVEVLEEQTGTSLEVSSRF